MKRLIAGALVLGLAACASAPKKPAPAAAADAPMGPATTGSAVRKVSPYAPAQEDPSTRGHYTAGGLYKPGVPDSTPDYVPDVDLIPEPDVIDLPRSRAGNRPVYSVLGKEYRVMDRADGYVEEGLASYYGKKFHGRRTSNLEVYDMNAFTAAHKTLPLPSFARVTNLDNGKTVVVRVNDRGPFHAGRIVDLSYAAAVKLGITQRGTGRVEVRALTAGEATPPMMVSAQPASAPSPSRLDQLVSDLPVGSGTALQLPPGVRIATGTPARMGATTASTSSNVTVAAPVAAMAGARSTPPIPARDATAENTTAEAGPDWRFDMRQNGKTMSANEFDAWMKARQVRIATGQPELVSAVPVPAVAVSSESATPAVVNRGEVITLQVASFSARSNADRALAMLHGAGIGDARLLGAESNGQPIWRLRVGPFDPAAAPQLAARIAGLGFGPPQRVRD